MRNLRNLLAGVIISMPERSRYQAPSIRGMSPVVNFLPNCHVGHEDDAELPDEQCGPLSKYLKPLQATPAAQGRHGVPESVRWNERGFVPLRTSSSSRPVSGQME